MISEILGEECFFYSENTKTWYKIVDYNNIDNIVSISNINYLSTSRLVIQECKLNLIEKTLIALDPENTKDYGICEIYEKVPTGRRIQMYWKIYKKIFNRETYSDLKIILTDKYYYKIVN